ncbi:MAG: deoxynucleoside kinase [Phycisphaerae bacterium]|nr:deoxynucleoside kinase [Phycisphaerae bacterium]
MTEPIGLPNESRLIAIAGLIGVGKTTLARNIAPLLEGHLVHEEYGKNPFLVRQFAGDKDAALPSELFFLLSRACQLDKKAVNAFPTVVCDYIFQKNRIFAQMNLDKSQMTIYDQIERSITPHLAKPEVVIYLHDTIENCMKRIAGRGRHYEAKIRPAWLKQLAGSYEDFFAGFNDCKVIRIDCAKVDLLQKENIRAVVDGCIKSQH